MDHSEKIVQNAKIAQRSAAFTRQYANLEIAVILPCKDEAVAIAQTIEGFQRALPHAKIYVFDNNSTDHTAHVARAAGATVYRAMHAGKGNVVRRMFADIDADVYVMADGDATYDATSAPDMIETLMLENLDMVTGLREHQEESAYRHGHQFGNRLLTGMVKNIFGYNLQDMLSGYRIFSRRFVKSFPAHSRGFEIETELTVHALELRMPVAEIATPYYARPENSHSKLSTYKDGFRILGMIGHLIKEEKPFKFFMALTALTLIPSMLMFLSVFGEYLQTGLVERIPTLTVAMAGFIIATLFIGCAVILDSIARGRREARHMQYLLASKRKDL